VGQKPIVQTLQNAIKANRIAQAYIFSGMRGVGKTTVARILAKALNCQHGPTPTPCNSCESCRAITEDRSIDVLEIDGASNRKVEDIGPIRDTAKYMPIHSRYKVIYIDEVHMLSPHAFNALLKTLEEPPERTVFIFATTEFHKVPPTIVSRCQHFEFKKISQKEIVNHLLMIAREEKITVSPYGLRLIAEASDGSLRDAQSLLDKAVAFSGETIQDEELKDILGAIGKDILFACSSLILDQKASGVFTLIEQVVERGYDLRTFYRELVEHFRNLLLAKSVKELKDYLPLNNEELAQLSQEAEKASEEEFLRYLLALQQAEAGLRNSSHPQIYLETVLVKLCHYKRLVPIEHLISEIERLKPEAVSSAESSPLLGSPSAAPLPQPPPKTVPTPDVPRAKKVDADEEKEIYAKILAELQKEKSSLAALFSRLSFFKLKDESMDIRFHPEKRFIIDQPIAIEIAFPAGEDFSRESVELETKTIEKIASAILGQKVKVRILDSPVGTKDRKGKEMELALKDPSVQAFMDKFHAQILSVEPIKGTKGKE